MALLFTSANQSLKRLSLHSSWITGGNMKKKLYFHHVVNVFHVDKRTFFAVFSAQRHKILLIVIYLEWTQSLQIQRDVAKL